ncbi:hypothetical protein CKAH01_08160 [Colletotrichum kahawae]|uniref:Uncharacterized protein n=1 Tax=Colletotrichum kahawae TaxID=34407 RepID=A0AAD9Y3D8_COLKA|nr:hypothetical protein CKAH01_08160 [Colletotrichum kahawae]
MILNRKVQSTLPTRQVALIATPFPPRAHEDRHKHSHPATQAFHVNAARTPLSPQNRLSLSLSDMKAHAPSWQKSYTKPRRTLSITLTSLDCQRSRNHRNSLCTSLSGPVSPISNSRPRTWKRSSRPGKRTTPKSPFVFPAKRLRQEVQRTHREKKSTLERNGAKEDALSKPMPREYHHHATRRYCYFSFSSHEVLEP